MTVRQTEGEEKEKEIKEIIEWERLCVMMRSRVLASYAVSSATIDDVFSTVSGDL